MPARSDAAPHGAAVIDRRRMNADLARYVVRDVTRAELIALPLDAWTKLCTWLAATHYAAQRHNATKRGTLVSEHYQRERVTP